MSKNFSAMARQLGSRGGRQRARSLSSERRIEIARAGAQARAESLRVARAIRTNFDYVAAMRQLFPAPAVESTSEVDERLPGIYA